MAGSRRQTEDSDARRRAAIRHPQEESRAARSASQRAEHRPSMARASTSAPGAKRSEARMYSALNEVMKRPSPSYVSAYPRPLPAPPAPPSWRPTRGPPLYAGGRQRAPGACGDRQGLLRGEGRWGRLWKGGEEREGYEYGGGARGRVRGREKEGGAHERVSELAGQPKSERTPPLASTGRARGRSEGGETAAPGLQGQWRRVPAGRGSAPAQPRPGPGQSRTAAPSPSAALFPRARRPPRRARSTLSSCTVAGRGGGGGGARPSRGVV